MKEQNPYESLIRSVTEDLFVKGIKTQTKIEKQ